MDLDVMTAGSARGRGGRAQESDGLWPSRSVRPPREPCMKSNESLNAGFTALFVSLDRSARLTTRSP